MKKMILCTLILMSFTLLGCEEKGIEQDYEEPASLEEEVMIKEPFTDSTLNYYQIEASLDPETSTITATQTIEYTNNEELDLTEIYLHLYPNAFTKDSQPNLFGNSDEKSDLTGKIEITSLLIDGNDIGFKDGPTTTSIEIDYAFMKNETYSIELDYIVSISSTSERFGIVKDIYNLGNWYPILAVYDEDGWNVDPYLSIGDPFYSDMSNYDIKMTVPKDYIVAGSGYIEKIENHKDEISYYFRADRMRDFAFVISDQFEYKKAQVNDTTVYLYYPKSVKKHKWLDDAMSFSLEAISSFEETIGDYPYKTYSVVLTNFPSGMEYPGLVLISKGYLLESIHALRTVIVHETAHQWFYGLIGDDEIDEGWIDEGLTSFFTAYFEIQYTGEYYYEDTMSRYQHRVEEYGFDNIIVAKSAKDFDDWGDYGVAAYSKPALMYDEIYRTYGDEKMQAFAKYLYEHYAYGILKEEDLREALNVIFGDEINYLLDTWLY